MNKLLVLYNEPKDPAHFRKYYVETHSPLVSRLPGLKASGITPPPAFAHDSRVIGRMGGSTSAPNSPKERASGPPFG